MSKSSRNSSLGEVLRRQRIAASLTLHELASISKVSASHLGRIERGERFPSASVLRKIAKPLGFNETELFTLAGFLTPQESSVAEPTPGYEKGQLAPYVADILAQEPIEIQQAIIGILSLLKTIARNLPKEKK